ncbi:ROK family protein [Jeotgalibacillus haloalkalitolerans]|uniref:fructokinase n=1 Tax=Jeotgalibacillus haloalkalitolerans TaxID=3104292 RepID=A0ABU5KHJ5_9BACL|nr:ROK family protein [Jeotgalibacillus sp. HH7-29]MDZ5710688.1 ROK family protein [Jeotgalibacillus sp. HH7-29]
MFGGIEAGGTKFVCAVGDEKGTVMKRIQLPTADPVETMPQVIAFFRQYPIKALGVGSFGPIDLNFESPLFGHITSTPKTAWRNYPLVKVLQDELRVPVRFTTDVNAAALGEAVSGAAKGIDSCLYITVGTGIGAGAVVSGKLLQGLSHPEMGHILLRRHSQDGFKGICPYHHDCLEGMASGPAIEARWGEKAEELKEKAEVWELEGYYLAQALMQYILILSPKKIILGGGVMNQKQLFSSVYIHLKELLNDYISLPNLSEYIVSPALGDHAGITGALILARDTYPQKELTTGKGSADDGISDVF